MHAIDKLIKSTCISSIIHSVIFACVVKFETNIMMKFDYTWWLKECQQSVIYHPLMPKVNYLCMIKSHENMYERMPTERNLSSFDAKSELSMHDQIT